jgi:hypothetical protein
MRVWDVPHAELCDRHLVGEHAEIHAVWSVIANGKAGYALHPEVSRWRGRLAALVARHDANVFEMTARGFKHRSPLLASEDGATQSEYVDPPEVQRRLLAAKPCGCPRIAQALLE